jgi:hypothetical protein
MLYEGSKQERKGWPSRTEIDFRNSAPAKTRQMADFEKSSKIRYRVRGPENPDQCRGSRPALMLSWSGPSPLLIAVVAAETIASVASARTCPTPQVVVAPHGKPGRTGPSSPHSGRDYIGSSGGRRAHRWATPNDAGCIQRFKKEPVALQPDLTADPAS